MCWRVLALSDSAHNIKRHCVCTPLPTEQFGECHALLSRSTMRKAGVNGGIRPISGERYIISDARTSCDAASTVFIEPCSLINVRRVLIIVACRVPTYFVPLGELRRRRPGRARMMRRSVTTRARRAPRRGRRGLPLGESGGIRITRRAPTTQARRAPRHGREEFERRPPGKARTMRARRALRHGRGVLRRRGPGRTRTKRRAPTQARRPPTSPRRCGSRTRRRLRALWVSAPR